MKYRDSGMPDAKLWDTFFDSKEILAKMEIDKSINTFLDIGCGYGTFLFPVSEIVGKAIGIDIDKNMIKYCEDVNKNLKKNNIKFVLGDISTEDSAAFHRNYKEYFDYISLFNILHCEEPIKLLESAKRLLNSDGKIGVIHWQYKETPRGPALEIRPHPEQIIEWAKVARLKLRKQVDLPPYHYGLIFNK